jgi:hypothetical protein
LLRQQSTDHPELQQSDAATLLHGLIQANLALSLGIATATPCDMKPINHGRQPETSLHNQHQTIGNWKLTHNIANTVMRDLDQTHPLSWHSIPWLCLVIATRILPDAPAFIWPVIKKCLNNERK